MITKLVTECYRSNASREDTALRDTMRAIRDRLIYNLTVQHPVTPNETITKGHDDPKARFLRDKLTDALSWLEVLSSPNCTRKDALAAWDKVFNTTYFINKLESENRDALRQTAAKVTTPSQPWLTRPSGKGRGIKTCRVITYSY